jgi:diaminopimelate decarboxylase
MLLTSKKPSPSFALFWRPFRVYWAGTLPAAWKMNHPFLIIPIDVWPYPFDRPSLLNKRVTLAGELCTPNDILARDAPCTCLRVGDIVLFRYAGAYGWDISHHDFLSHPHPEFIYLA